jgi:hypothetical protein
MCTVVKNYGIDFKLIEGKLIIYLIDNVIDGQAMLLNHIINLHVLQL